MSRFDEQLHLQSAAGWPYAGLNYTLTLADGSIATGRTDSEGRTERVDTSEPVAITKAELASDRLYCCERHFDNARPTGPVQVMQLLGVATSAIDIGSSVVMATALDAARPLTIGEVSMARLMFKEALDYSKVKVHNGAFLVGQHAKTAMTPNGEMYFLHDDFVEDFSEAEKGDNRGKICGSCVAIPDGLFRQVARFDDGGKRAVQRSKIIRLRLVKHF